MAAGAVFVDLLVGDRPAQGVDDAVPASGEESRPAEDELCPALHSCGDASPKVVEVEAELAEAEACCSDDEPEVAVPTAHGYTSMRRVPTAAVWGRSINPYAALRGWRP
ncbi:hypothetical protein [Mycobacterium nebraskense]|uniref:hypothetical protein n=1 Tax=Mycobacterium nebraskense TaxID=244292 RepID=UPI0023F0643C|nr:hypothetical protein [Mycobacterium nebraskense]MBI2692773.1 hypothetical protein [Mycobacterium nebraskense]